MRKTRLAVSAVALAAALALSACPPHGVVYTGVTFGPPAPLVRGPVGMAPGPGFVWTDGYYTWGGNNWAWQQGRWARPPHPGYVWRRPTYQRFRGGYRMQPGRWARR